MSIGPGRKGESEIKCPFCNKGMIKMFHKEGYFQEILKCKTAKQVVRREKETLINHFYGDFPALKEHLKTYGAYEISHEQGEELMKHIFSEVKGPGEPGSTMSPAKRSGAS